MAGSPVQVTGTVLTMRRVDAYHAMTVVAPGIADRFRPGHFVTVAVGGPRTSTLTRRAFAVHDVKPDYGGTVELVFTVRGAGTAWLADRRARDPLDLIGPLGRPFPIPRDPASCLLVGSEHGAAGLFALADVLQQRNCRVDFVLGAASSDRVFGAPAGPADGRDGDPHDPRRLSGCTGLGGRRPARRDRRHPRRRRLRRRADGDAGRGDRRVRGTRHPRAGQRRGVDGLRHRRLHDLYRSRDRRRRRHPHDQGVRRRPGLPGRAGPFRGRRHDPVRRPRRAGRATVPADMRTYLAHVELPNPILTAAGCAGTGRELAPFADVTRLGALTTPTITMSPRAGRPTPRMAETPSGLLNAVGLQGPGIEAFLSRELPWLAERGVRTVVSIGGGSVAEFSALARKLTGAPGVTALEVNLSCPNVEDRGRVFARDPSARRRGRLGGPDRRPLRPARDRQAGARRGRRGGHRQGVRRRRRRGPVDDQHPRAAWPSTSTGCARPWPPGPAACPGLRPSAPGGQGRLAGARRPARHPRHRHGRRHERPGRP